MKLYFSYICSECLDRWKKEVINTTNYFNYHVSSLRYAFLILPLFFLRIIIISCLFNTQFSIKSIGCFYPINVFFNSKSSSINYNKTFYLKKNININNNINLKRLLHRFSNFYYWQLLFLSYMYGSLKLWYISCISISTCMYIWSTSELIRFWSI
jgi:hypothetical protein